MSLENSEVIFMKQILPKLKEVSKYLNFLKKCFTKPQFNHVKNYVGGLIALNKKTINSITKLLRFHLKAILQPFLFFHSCRQY